MFRYHKVLLIQYHYIIDAERTVHQLHLSFLLVIGIVSSLQRVQFTRLLLDLGQVAPEDTQPHGVIGGELGNLWRSAGVPAHLGPANFVLVFTHILVEIAAVRPLRLLL